jgi:hypothetical protein
MCTAKLAVVHLFGDRGGVAWPRVLVEVAMRDLLRVLQNPDASARPNPHPAERPRLRESDRLLSPFETDALLADRFARRRVFPDFQDNYSGDFHLFRIY